jgi:hypothetical protein
MRSLIAARMSASSVSLMSPPVSVRGMVAASTRRASASISALGTGVTPTKQSA